MFKFANTKTINVTRLTQSLFSAYFIGFKKKLSFSLIFYNLFKIKTEL